MTWQNDYKLLLKAIDPNLKDKDVDLILNYFPTHEEAYYAFVFILSQVLPQDMPTREKIKIIKLNMEIFSNESMPKEIKLGDYKIIKSKDYSHSEAQNQYEIQNKNGVRIATFNFYFIQPKGPNKKLELRINNIQGWNSKRMIHSEDIEQELKKLNEYLGENWRVTIVKILKEISERYGFRIIGELPIHYKKEFEKKMIRLYLQTYLKAGIQLEDIDFSMISNENKEWIRRNLQIKKERLEGKRPMQRTEPKRKTTKNKRLV